MTTLIVPKTTVRRRAIALGLGALCYLLFLVCYAFVIAPSYFYMGFTIQMLPGWCWVASLALALLPLLWMPLDLGKPSDFASWILYLCLILPACVMIPMVSDRSAVEAMCLVTVLSGCFFLLCCALRVPQFKICSVRNARSLFSVGLPLLMVVLALAVFCLGGFKIDLSFDDVYTRRLAAREIVPGGSLMGYAIALLKSVCIPFAIGIGVQWKKWTYVALAVLAAVAIFSLDGSKGTVIAPVVLALIVTLASRKRKNIGFVLMGLIACLLALSSIEYFTIGTQKLAVMFVQREMAMPSQLTAYYWDFFSQNPHVMMTDGIVGKVLSVESPYSVATPRLIGSVYYSNADTNANANIWASGFADFGYAGMAMISILAAFILRIVDSLSSKGRFVLASVCSSAIALAWVNGALHTSILSNGIAGLIIALWLFPAQSDHKQLAETNS